MTYTLHPPGTRSARNWMMRGTLAGHQFEVSCKTADRDAADRFAVDFVRRLQADLDQRTPRARSVGAFEHWILDAFYWSEGLVLRKSGGILRFHQAAHGYRSAKVKYEDETRTVLEHRVVFLLVNGWLPESIDHKNRDRGDNRPSNLEASTPRQQARNRGKPRTSSAQVVDFPTITPSFTRVGS